MLISCDGDVDVLLLVTEPETLVIYGEEHRGDGEELSRFLPTLVGNCGFCCVCALVPGLWEKLEVRKDTLWLALEFGEIVDIGEEALAEGCSDIEEDDRAAFDEDG